MNKATIIRIRERLQNSKLKATEAIGRQYSCTIVIEGADAKIEGTFPVDVVVDVTSYFTPGYKFTQKYRSGIWDGRTKLFSKIKRTFPAGLAKIVLDELRAKKVQVQLDDRRYCPNYTVKFPETLPGATFTYPFDFQPVCAYAMARHQRGVVGVATNGGKTTIAALMIAAVKIPTLFMVPNRTLLYQTQKVMVERLGLKMKDVGLIGDGHWEPTPWVTVGTADTLFSRLDKPKCRDFLKSTQMIFADECFVAGMKVDRRPIEEIRVGDEIRSFNEETGRFEKSLVEKIFINKPTMLVCVKINGKKLICTPGHPFWTKRGWIPAVALQSSDMVLRSIQNSKGGDYANSEMQFLWDGCRTHQDQKQRSLLSEMSREKVVSSQEDCFDEMLCLSERSESFWQEIETSQSWKSLLQQRMQRLLDVQNIIRNYERYQSQKIRNHLGENEEEQSYGGSQCQSQTENNPQSHGMETTHTGGEWETIASTSAAFGQSSGVENGSSHSYQAASKLWIPNLLQSRYCRGDTEDSCGDRRWFSLYSGETKTRSKEREVSGWFGVESVEVLEQTSDGTFGGLCPDGLVYNLQVKKNHTYLVEDCVVHNCHHVASDSWYMVMRACEAFYRFGLSGTPLRRSDGADLRLIGVTGPVIFEVKNKELVERKISVQPIVHFLKITQPLLPPKLPYKEVHRLGIVENPYRNNELCKVVAEFVEQGLSALIVVDEINHGEILDKRLWTFKQQSFIPHQFINGQEDMETRHKALADFRRGDLKILIATSILNEGLDMPNIDVLALAAGGKSAINLMQRIGRGLRRGGNSEHLHVIDTADFQHKYLLKHSLQRMEEYKEQDCFEIKVAEAQPVTRRKK